MSNGFWAQRIGEAEVLDHDGDVRKVEIEIDYHEWDEPHTAGSATVYERQSEYTITDSMLDGRPVSMDHLIWLFGKARATEAIDAATEHALRQVS